MHVDSAKMPPMISEGVFGEAKGHNFLELMEQFFIIVKPLLPADVLFHKAWVCICSDAGTKVGFF